MRRERGDRGQRPGADLVEWFTVSYRTIYIAGAVVLGLCAAVGYWYYKAHQEPRVVAVETESTAATAQFVNIEGSVLVKVAGSLRWDAANKTMVLSKADLVRTGAGSSAEIKFFNGAVFKVRPDCVFIVEESSEDPRSRQRRAAVKVQSGEVNFLLQRDVPGSATTISTPTVRTTAADEAEGRVVVTGGGASTLSLFRGTMEGQTSTGERLTLAANEGVKIDAEGRAGPKLTLPGVPTLMAPPPNADISYPNPEEAITLLAWKAVPEAVAYHVLVDMTASFNRPVVVRKEWRSLSMELRGLEVGGYYWQVAAVDKDGSQGNFCEPSRFVVSQGTPRGAPPALSLEPLNPRGRTVQVKGRTEAGAAVTVNDLAIQVRADGSFNEILTLNPGRQEIVVRAVGSGGGVAEQRRPVVAPE
jgi:hypothetical protein